MPEVKSMYIFSNFQDMLKKALGSTSGHIYSRFFNNLHYFFPYTTDKGASVNVVG